MHGGVGLSLSGIEKTYVTGTGSITALADLTFSVEPGSVVAVVGPSGSGKSTLLHLIGAMDSADRGTIQVGEQDVTSLGRRQQSEYRRTVGFVFQRFHLLPALTVLDNVAAPLLPYRTSFDKFDRARELLAAVGLSGREESLPSQLSGGQQQRVAIARALVNDPGVLLADEPTGNLDSETGADIMALLLDLRRDRGTTVMIATHNHVLASRCDRVIRLLDGRLVDEVSVLPAEEPELLLEKITRIEGQ